MQNNIKPNKKRINCLCLSINVKKRLATPFHAAPDTLMLLLRCYLAREKLPLPPHRTRTRTKRTHADRQKTQGLVLRQTTDNDNNNHHTDDNTQTHYGKGAQEDARKWVEHKAHFLVFRQETEGIVTGLRNRTNSHRLNKQRRAVGRHQGCRSHHENPRHETSCLCIKGGNNARGGGDIYSTVACCVNR